MNFSGTNAAIYLLIRRSGESCKEYSKEPGGVSNQYKHVPWPLPAKVLEVVGSVVRSHQLNGSEGFVVDNKEISRKVEKSAGTLSPQANSGIM